MALYFPVTKTADLPNPGTGGESGTYDFKTSVDFVDPKKRRELAKDVAAFANATGGVILVGAVEDKETGALKTYSGMSEEIAHKVKAAYDSAVVDLCRPQPIADAAPLHAPPPFDGFVVAVNVNATPLSPVGVRWGEDLKHPAWAFPLRATTHTTYLSPTELPMLMVPEVRRVMILLDEIPLTERGSLQIFHNRPQAQVPMEVTLRAVDRTTLIVTRYVNTTVGRVESTLPLDRVTSVWRNGTDGWAIALNGGLQVDAMGGLKFTP